MGKAKDIPDQMRRFLGGLGFGVPIYGVICGNGKYSLLYCPILLIRRPIYRRVRIDALKIMHYLMLAETRGSRETAQVAVYLDTSLHGAAGTGGSSVSVIPYLLLYLYTNSRKIW